MDYKVLRTKIGLAKFANFPVTQTPIAFKYLAVGDGGGVPVEPNQNQTALIRETARVQINTITKDPNNDAQFIIEAIIPEGVGNFYIREAGVFDEAGDLILIANYPESYKPLMAEGSGKVLRIRLILEESNAAAVTLKIDPSVVLATREYVDITIGNKINNLRSELSKISVFLYGSVPTTKQGEIIYAEPFGFMKWVPKWNMYRSINCGKKEYGNAVTPAAGYIEANGAWYSKTGAYKGLWTAALDNEVVLPPENWHIGQYIFIDEGGDQFRVPDLRGYYDRNASQGSTVDAGRVIFSGQDDAMVKLTGSFQSRRFIDVIGGVLPTPNGNGLFQMKEKNGPTYVPFNSSAGVVATDTMYFDNSFITRTADENRTKNTAYPAWLKI